MVLLRIFPQDNYSEEEKEQKEISVAAMKSAKVIPDNFQEVEEDRTVLNQVKDIDIVEMFNSEDKTPLGLTRSAKIYFFNLDEDEDDKNYLKRKRFNLNEENVSITSKYEYYLREYDHDYYEEEVEVDEEGGSESIISSCIMKSSLFENCGLFEIINDDILIQRLHKIIFYETLHGPEPKLPFNLESFLQFLFVESRDLKLIRVMLRICQSFPIILVKYDQDTKAQDSETGIRENLMLRFLVNVQNLDKVAARITIQLMGFRNIIQLMNYYEDYMPNDPMIVDAMNKLGHGNSETNDFVDQNKNESNHEYISDQDMV